MLQIVEVEQKGLTNDIRNAYCLAAAERFLGLGDCQSFTKQLGEVTDSTRRISRSVFFYGPLTTPRTVVSLSRERGGVVVVPHGHKDPNTRTQQFYAAWLSN